MTRCCSIADSTALVARFMRDEEGSTAIEYGLIVSLIFLAIIAAVNDFATKSNAMYSNVQSALTN